MSSRVAGRPRLRDNSVNQTRVLIWNSEGYRGGAMTSRSRYANLVDRRGSFLTVSVAIRAFRPRPGNRPPLRGPDLPVPRRSARRCVATEPVPDAGAWRAPGATSGSGSPAWHAYAGRSGYSHHRSDEFR